MSSTYRLMLSLLIGLSLCARLSLATPGEGCITLRGVVVQDAGGPDACTVISGGGTSSAVLAGNDCAIEIEVRISNWACVGPEARLMAWQAHFGNEPDLPAGIDGAELAPCANSDAECLALGYDDGCVDFNGDFIEDHCPRTWQVPTLPNDLVLDISACSQTSYVCGSQALEDNEVLDNGSEYYAMTMRLYVEAGATGVITLPLLNNGIDSFVITSDQVEHPFGKVIDATMEIPIGRCCDETGGCIDGVTSNECPAGIESWRPDASCTSESCSGACCDRLGGGCVEGVPPASCPSPRYEWSETATCGEFDPACEAPAGRCCDEDGGCTDGVMLDECPDGLERNFWQLGGVCTSTSCLGACCDRINGGCTESVPVSTCSDVGHDWFEGSTCDEVEPPCNPCPPGGAYVTFRTVVVEEAGGADACTVISGGGTSAAVLAGNGCDIELEVRISDWECVGPFMGLRAWQVQFGSPEAGDFPTGISGVGLPACPDSDAVCTALGYDSGCRDIDSDSVGDRCERAWETPTLPNDLLLGLNACSQNSYTCGSAAFPAGGEAFDNGSEYYAMTARVHVDAGTTGTIEIPLQNPGEDTFVIMADSSIPPISNVIDASIHIPTGRCCDVAGGCVDGVTLDDCPAGAGSWLEGGACDQIPPCTPPIIPTVSEWGLVILTLLLLVGAKIHFAWRRTYAM